MKVVFFAYRNWALNIVDHFKLSTKVEVLDTVSSIDDYYLLDSYSNDSVDYVILIGWSHIIKKPMLEKFTMIGIHPSDLPNYAGGSPLQHQIIDGIKNTYCSLFYISEIIDGGEIINKHPFSLLGDSMDVILKNLEISSIKLLESFFNDQNITNSYETNINHNTLKRRRPEDSEINSSLLNINDIEPLYNFIRALTSPYPNAYIQDKKGNRLYFEKVSFVPGAIDE